MSATIEETALPDPTVGGHIEITPGVCSGRARIKGRRVRVQDIVLRHETWGMTPDEVVECFPGVTLADVYAALVYYHDHAEQIRSEMQIDSDRIAQLEAAGPSLGEKIKARYAQDNSLPPR